MIRAVLDTNVLVSALISREGAPAQLLTLWSAGEFELIASRALLAELELALNYSKIRRVVSVEEARDYVNFIAARASLAEDPTVEALAPDPKDDFVLGLARSTADLLVTGDRGIVTLRIEGLAILTPRAFLDALSG